MALAAACLAIAGGPPDALAQVGFGGPPDAVKVRAVPERAAVAPGDRLPIAIVLDFEDKFHSWPNKPVVPPEFGDFFEPIPTTIDPVSVPAGVQLGQVQWPAPSMVRADYGTGPIEFLSYAGRAVAYVPAIIPASAPAGEMAIDFQVGYQACDETQCYAPEMITVRASVAVAASADRVSPADGPPPAAAGADLFKGFDPRGYEATVEGSTAAAAGGVSGGAPGTVAINVFGRSFDLDPSGGAGMVLLLLVAALGGVLLNFTPCVLPVLPFKVLALSRAAGTPRRLALLGVCMALGVVAFWLAIGGAIAYVAGFTSISSLFQTGWFAFVVGIVVAAMAVGMLGVFEFQAPQWAYQVNPSQDTVQGSLLFGVMTAVLSTPCTAPFMGSASAWAATQSPPVTLATFGAIGAGMALPYLLLSLRPGLLHRVPRSGPGSVLVKQVMGLFMLAVAAFFIGTSLSAWLHVPPDPVSRRYWWAVVLFVVIACAWLVYGTVKVTPSPAKRVAFGGAGVAIAVASLYLARGLASEGPIDWVHFTPERLAAAEARGDVVVMDFTAEWCLNCKALEAAVLHQPEVVDLLSRPGVTPVKVDLTGDNPDGRAQLQALGWVGIPLLAVFGPGTGYEDTPLKYDSYTVATVRDAVEQAARAARAEGEVLDASH